MNPKDALELLPAGVRAALYSFFALTGVAFGAIQVGYGALEAPQPAWLTVALAVYAFVGGAFGLVAVTHTDKDMDAPLVDPEAVAKELAVLPQTFTMPEGDLYAGAVIETGEVTDVAITDTDTDAIDALPDLVFPPIEYDPKH